jgi:hypothetical protein
MVTGLKLLVVNTYQIQKQKCLLNFLVETSYCQTLCDLVDLTTGAGVSTGKSRNNG